MKNESKRVCKGNMKGGLRMKPIIILFCLSLLLLFATSFVFADAIVNVEQTKSELLKPYIQTGVAVKEIPMKHLSPGDITKGPILGGFDGRDLPWSANILAGDGWGGSDPDKYTSMAIGPDDAIYVAYQSMHSTGIWTVGIARSADNGQNWTGNAMGYVGIDCMYPDVAVDSDGYIWIYCTYYDSDPSGEIFWFKSVNANNIGSFSGYWLDDFAGADEYYLHPSVEVFGSDGTDLHVFSAWTYDDGTADDQMCIVYNTDGSSSGGSTVGTFAADGETDMHPDVAISDNNVIMANIEDVSGDQELRIWYLDIPGVWAGNLWNVLGYTIAGDDDYPSLSATGTNVFVAFQNDAGSGNWNINHGNSVDEGATWDLGAYVANSANSERYPRVTGQGLITGCVYLEESNVRFRQSANLGQSGTWAPDLLSSPERVTDQDAADESERSASVYHTGTFWVATWTDNRNFGTKDFDIWSSYRSIGTSQIGTKPAFLPSSEYIYFDFTQAKGFGKLSYITKYCERTYHPVLSEGTTEKIKDATEDEIIGVLVTMKKQVSYDYLRAKTTPLKRKQRRDFVWKELSEYTKTTQSDILDYLYQMENQGKAERIRSIFTGNRVSVRATKDVIEELARRDDVGWITPEVPAVYCDQYNNSISNSSEPDAVESNILAVNADDVWASGYTGSGIIVGVMDSGANYSHNDLNDHLWTGTGYPNGGYDFENDDTDPSDDNGHGTIVSGIVCGDGTNGTETGVAPDATLMILRTRYNTDMHAAVDFAISGGSAAGDPADVLQASVGFDRGLFGSDAAWEDMKNEFRPDAIDLLAAGICWTYAAGNGDGGGGHYTVPDDIIIAANCPPPWLDPDDQTIKGETSACIAVGATNNTRSRQTWSSYGPSDWDNGTYSDYPYGGSDHGLLKPDIMAPGASLTSLARTGQGYDFNNSGTSFSAPHLAGAIALMLSKDGSLLPAKIDSVLESTTLPVVSFDPNGADHKDSLNGNGFLNVEAACLGIGTAQKAILKVANQKSATGILVVTDITNTEPWIVKVDPKAFNVSPGDTQYVDVWADTTGFTLVEGINYDILSIESNSETKTTTEVEVRLAYLSETAIEFTNLTAIGYVRKIELKWRTASEYNIEAWQVVRSETAEGDYTLVGVLPGQGSTSVPHDYLFTDSDVIGGKRYYYKLVSIDNMGTTTYGPVSAVARIGSTVGIFSLVSNPTRSASIRFSIFEDSRVSINVYSITGRLVKTLVNDVLSPDSYEISWDGRSETGRHVGSGVYFIKMDAAGEKATLKLTLLK